MSDEEIRKLLIDAFLSEEWPPLTDEDVDIFLYPPEEEGPPEELERARGEFAAKVLKCEYEIPFQRIDPGLPFGRWLRGIRESVGLSPGAIAARLEEDERFIAGLESSRSRPWDFPPDVIARVMVLFRIHVNAIRSLADREPGDEMTSQAGAHIIASNDPSGLSAPTCKWLQEVEQTLERLGAIDLTTR